MQFYRTENDIRKHIATLIEARKPTMSAAHSEFNKGIQWMIDYVTEFMDVKRFTVDIDRERKELAQKLSEILKLPSENGIHPELKSLPYVSYSKNFDIQECLINISFSVLRNELEKNSSIFWVEYPTYEKTNNGMYMHCKFVIVDKYKKNPL